MMLSFKLMSVLSISLLGGVASAVPTANSKNTTGSIELIGSVNFTASIGPLGSGHPVLTDYHSTDTINLLNGLPVPTDYFSTVLYHHNIHRMNHSAGLLSYNNDLANDCGVVTRACGNVIDLGNFFGLSGNIPPGSSPAEMTATAIAFWYNSEMLNYIPASDDFTIEPTYPSVTFNSYGHFTQVVWHAATQVGCWSNSCPAESLYCKGATFCWFVLCKYDTGNVIGSFLENVLPPKNMAYDSILPWIN